MTVKSAGQLREVVTFQCRLETSDGYGNEITGAWTDQFTVRARLQPKLGGEQTIASRMAGIQPIIMTVRSSPDTVRVTSAWRAYDASAGLDDLEQPKRLFNIKSGANVDEKNAYLDFLVAEGEPS